MSQPTLLPCELKANLLMHTISAVDGEVISSIKRGLLVLVGVATTDGEHELDWLATKLLAMKLFPNDEQGEPWGWKSSVVDREGEVLCGESC